MVEGHEAAGRTSGRNRARVEEPAAARDDDGMGQEVTERRERNAADHTSDDWRNASYFRHKAWDEAAAGVGAGMVATLAMHPLDLIRTRFQIDDKGKGRRPERGTAIAAPSRSNVQSKFGLGVYRALKAVVGKDGWTGLYRGLGPNIIGNCSSWGLYFLFYTQFKEYLAHGQPRGRAGVDLKLNTGQHLLAATSAGVLSAFLTNPIWVVRTRIFATSRAESVSLGSSSVSPSPATAYRGLFQGLYRIARYEGVRGLWKGNILALVGVSNGAIQFVTYEKLKKWRFRSREHQSAAEKQDLHTVHLTNSEYIILSGSAKLFSIFLTYPYQVIRSRLQNDSLAVSSAAKYDGIVDCIKKTVSREGPRALYKGLAPNALRVLPGTCVMFLAYENLSQWLRDRAVPREEILQARPVGKPAQTGRSCHVDCEAGPASEEVRTISSWRPWHSRRDAASLDREEKGPIGYLTRTLHISCAHRLHSQYLTTSENSQLYGKCNRPSGHGHNYVIEVTVRGPIHQRTGMIMDLESLKECIAHVETSLDHRNLDVDVPWFAAEGRPSTAENIAVFCWHELEQRITVKAQQRTFLEPGGPPVLHEVRVRETDKNWVTFRG